MSGDGFGTPETLASIAKSSGRSMAQPLVEVNTVLFDPIIQSFTFAANARDASNPLHPAIFDQQVISLLSAEKTFEFQQIVLISPNNTGGTFNISTPDRSVTSVNMVFLSDASIMRDAVISLGLATDVIVTYSRVRLVNGTDVVTWNLTYPFLRPIEAPIINSQDNLFAGVVWSVTRIRPGVLPFFGNWTVALPGLNSSVSEPISYNATAEEVQAALSSLTFPSVFKSLDVVSVTKAVVSGPASDFYGAGSTTWTWTVALRLHPFEGIDPNGHLPDMVTDASGLQGGFGVQMSVLHPVIGQAGLQPPNGPVTIRSDSESSPIVAHTNDPSSILFDTISALRGIELFDVSVTASDGWSLNDNGFSAETGYGVGAQSLLGGLGVAVTWIITYVPAGMIEQCTDAGSMAVDAFLVFDGSHLTGSNVSTVTTTLQRFRCSSLPMDVRNHTNTNLRVHMPRLAGHVLSYPEFYKGLLGAPVPAGWWRSPGTDASGAITGFIPNTGYFGGEATLVGQTVTFQGFSPRDADAAISIQASARYVVVPFRCVRLSHAETFAVANIEV